MKRGVLYVVWGDKIEPLLQRSIASVRRFYPHIPIEIVHAGEPDPERGLAQKVKMASKTPFESTLFLDADTVVLGNLDFAFDRAEQFGLACVICECPWLRRYGASEGDQLEYNTGVLFFSPKSRPVFDAWEELSATCPSRTVGSAPTASFVALNSTINPVSPAPCGNAAATRTCCRLITTSDPNSKSRSSRTSKIWHSRLDVPNGLAEVNSLCESGQRLVQFLHITVEQ